jgi:hypothetical protein
MSEFVLSEQPTMLGLAAWYAVMAYLISLRWRDGHSGLTGWMMATFAILAVYHSWVALFIVHFQQVRPEALALRLVLVITITGLMVELWQIAKR